MITACYCGNVCLWMLSRVRASAAGEPQCGNRRCAPLPGTIPRVVDQALGTISGIISGSKQRRVWRALGVGRVLRARRDRGDESLRGGASIREAHEGSELLTVQFDHIDEFYDYELKPASDTTD